MGADVRPRGRTRGILVLLLETYWYVVPVLAPKVLVLVLRTYFKIGCSRGVVAYGV